MLATGFLGEDNILSVPPPPYSPMVVQSAGRTRVPRPATIGSDTAVIVTLGQSLTANYVGGEKLTGPSNLLQINLFDGALYVAQDPLLGVDTFLADPNSNSNFAIRLGRLMLFEGPWNRVIVLPLGVGGTHVSEWADGGQFNARISAGVSRLRQLGLDPTAILWQQGTTDSSLGTSAAAMAAGLQSMVETWRRLGLDRTPILVAQDSWVSGVLYEQVRAGQRAVWNAASGIYPGPDIDLITERRDAAHMSAVGAQKQAEAWLVSLRSALTAAGTL